MEMRTGSRLIRIAILLAFIVALVAGTQQLLFSPPPTPRAFAHANLARSEPSPNSVLESPPASVIIWYTEPLEPEFSRINVLDVQGMRVDGGDSRVDPNDPTAMLVSVPSLTRGTYTVAWSNVSTVDGHRVRGSFVFSVGEPIASVAQPDETSDQPLLQSPLEPVLRWLTLLSALTIVGGLAFELAVVRYPLPGVSSAGTPGSLGHRIFVRTMKLQWSAIGLLLAASLGHLILQTASVNEMTPLESLGRPLISLLSGTDWGHLWLWRIGCLLVLAALLGLLLVPGLRTGGSGERGHHEKPESFRRVLRGLALAAGIGMLITFSLTSHGAATAEVRSGAVLNDYLHLLAAAFWVGGLFHLALTVKVIVETLDGIPRRRLLTQMVSRFSILAILCTGTLVITGLYSAWAQVTVFQAVATPYGRALVVKLLLMAPLLVLGALKLMWVKPRLERDDQAGQWLLRIVSGEVFFAVMVLLSVGLLTSLEPARQVASRQEIGTESLLTFQDTVEGAEITLAIEPGRVGPNRFLVSLKDPLGSPITNVTDVTLSLDFQDADLGTTAFSARPMGDGEFVLDGQLLSIAGLWQVELTVLRPDAFDARTAFRFTVATGGAGGSSSISPTAETGKLLLGIELALLGSMFLVTGIPLGGWNSRGGAVVMGSGLLSALAGMVLVFIALGGPSTPETLRNPFPPNPQSLAVGQQVYNQSCQGCHGARGGGGGPDAAGLDPPPSDLTVHVPLHPDGDLFRFIHDGISGTAMPAWRGQLTEEEIWHTVNYIKGLAPAEQ